MYLMHVCNVEFIIFKGRTGERGVFLEINVLPTGIELVLV